MTASVTGSGAKRRRHRVFVGLALLLPLALLGTLEVTLRLVGFASDRELTKPVAGTNGQFSTLNEHVGKRYFPNDANPPSPSNDVFLTKRSSRGLRIVVLGESAAAGFPYAHNGSFSRVLGDAVRRQWPTPPVEVINVAIAATNSFTLVDLVDDVLALKPDAVLIYAGHNEYYGAFGVASTVRWSGGPTVVRTILSLSRTRVGVLAARTVRGALAVLSPMGTARVSTSRMETMARRAGIPLGSADYEAGVRQFEENIDIVLARLRESRVATLIGSPVSNERGLAPFDADSSEAAAAARSAFLRAESLLAVNDPRAAELFARARDLDPLRFRAPSEFERVVKRASLRHGALYVPVREAFAARDSAGSPGARWFFEHVHFRPEGAVLVARAFFDALRSHPLTAGHLREVSDQEWPYYQERMALTALDHHMAGRTVQALLARWPFTAASASRGELVAAPSSFLDTLAIAWSDGQISWAQAKLLLIKRALDAHDADAVLAEARGLMRDQPLLEMPFRIAGRALLAAGRGRDAREYFDSAIARAPSAEAYTGLAAALSDSAPARAAALLQQSLALMPEQPTALLQLSRLKASVGDTGRARQLVSDALRLAPTDTAILAWQKRLGRLH